MAEMCLEWIGTTKVQMRVFVGLVKYTINNTTENDSKEYVGNRRADLLEEYGIEDDSN